MFFDGRSTSKKRDRTRQSATDGGERLIRHAQRIARIASQHGNLQSEEPSKLSARPAGVCIEASVMLVMLTGT